MNPAIPVVPSADHTAKNSDPVSDSRETIAQVSPSVAASFTPDARAVVLRQYRRVRERGVRPWMAMDDLMQHSASSYMSGAAGGMDPSRPVQQASLGEWTAARAYRTEMIARRERQAERRGIQVSDSFWAHGQVGLMPRAAGRQRNTWGRLSA